MHDPAFPSPEEPSPGVPGPTGAGYAAAVEAVHRVIAWYGRQIFDVQRADDPDPARLEQLMARQRACLQDRKALEEAGPEEVERIAAHYAVRLKEIKAEPGSQP